MMEHFSETENNMKSTELVAYSSFLSKTYKREDGCCLSFTPWQQLGLCITAITSVGLVCYLHSSGYTSLLLTQSVAGKGIVLKQNFVERFFRKNKNIMNKLNKILKAIVLPVVVQ